MSIRIKGRYSEKKKKKLASNIQKESGEETEFLLDREDNTYNNTMQYLNGWVKIEIINQGL